jgi:hypothetical protein
VELEGEAPAFRVFRQLAGLARQPAYIDAAHRAHARVEDAIRIEGLRHRPVPSHDFPINSAWLAAALITATLLAVGHRDSHRLGPDQHPATGPVSSTKPASRSWKEQRRDPWNPGHPVHCHTRTLKSRAHNRLTTGSVYRGVFYP